MPNGTARRRAAVSRAEGRSPLHLLIESLAKPQPLKMADYLAAGGSTALGRALSLGRDALLDMIEASGLVCRDGRGVAGEIMRGVGCDKGSVVVCHGHRPFAPTIDRLVLEQCPHAVIEGMAIAACAIGASSGWICASADLGGAVARSLLALDECAKVGLVGESVLGEDFAFSTSVRKVEKGQPFSDEALLDSPRVAAGRAFVSSPETFLHLQALLLLGEDALRGWASEGECGTKLVVCGAGADETVGELPLGADVVSWARERVGDPDALAFQIGAPLGIFARLSGSQVLLGPQTLARLGPMADAGIVAPIEPRTCIVHFTRQALARARDGLAGGYSSFQIGFEHVVRTLRQISHGEATNQDVSSLRELSVGLLDLGPCPLGRAAIGLLLSALDEFGSDFELHATLRRCPAATCECVEEAPCTHACPMGINVAQFVGLTTKKAGNRTVDLIRRRNPFPGVCGHICHKPCEGLCVLAKDGDAIAIRDLEASAALADERKRPPLLRWRSSSGKKVAVIGAGPSGLSAAYFLTAMGHTVTIYDRGPQVGGLLASTVPSYLLPPEVLARDIGRTERGVRKRLESPIETKQRLAQLLRKGDGVLIASGMACPAPSAIPGASAEGVVDGLSFLRDCRAGESDVHGHVVVIGHGLIAAHAARLAASKEPRSVTWLVVERSLLPEIAAPSASDLEASREETDAAVAEGARLVLSPFDIEIVERARRVSGVTWRTAAGGQEKHAAQTVVLALGRMADIPFLPHKSVELRADGRVVVDSVTGQTGLEGVFAAGECAHGPMRVAEAIASSIRAAQHMDLYLGGDGEMPRNFDSSFLDDQVMGRQLPTADGRRVDVLNGDDDEGRGALAYRESQRCRRCRIFA